MVTLVTNGHIGHKWPHFDLCQGTIFLDGHIGHTWSHFSHLVTSHLVTLVTPGHIGHTLVTDVHIANLWVIFVTYGHID